MRLVRGLLRTALSLALLVSVGCGGGGGDGVPLVVIDQNILHGILDEDPAAEPFDRYPERLELIAASLAARQPDVIFLQEVLTQGETHGVTRSTLLDALGAEYRDVFGSITGEAGDQGLGQMTLTRLPIVSSENRLIGGPRAVHRVTVETEEGNIDLYNAHLDGTDPDDPQFGVDEIEKVLAFIEETRTGSGPVILAGDFNAEPGDPSIQALLAAGFLDLLVVAGDPTCAAAGDPGCTNSTIPLGDNAENRADARIDYVFVLPGDGPSLEIDSAALFNNQPADLGDGRLLWPSDHIGVATELRLRP